MHTVPTIMANDQEPTPLCHIVTPVGMLGYGFDEAVIDAELSKLTKTSVPTAIILDSGSTDAGPSNLATGRMNTPMSSYKRDLVKLVKLINVHHVPLIFSSAGGDGSNDHVNQIQGLVEEVINEAHTGRQFKTLSIYAEVSKSLVRQRLAQGQVAGCGGAVPDMTEHDIDTVARIVAQMGCEPFLDAMFGAPDFNIIVGGRAYDPSPYVAYAAYQAMSGSGRVPVASLGEKVLGGMFHMGKIMECGGLCATPKSTSAMATVYTDGSFDIRALAKSAKCTPISVAAHTLYEKSRPDLLYGPGGCLDLSSSKYEQLPDGVSVRIRGALFRALPTEDTKYNVKLEGGRVLGYRTVSMGVFKDPILISQLDDLLKRVHQWAQFQHAEVTDNWQLKFHRYGTEEVFIVMEALADTQALASSITSTARVACIHGPYPGQKATSGNLAFGLGGKGDLETGMCAEFCVYHLMDLNAGEEGAREIHDDKDIVPALPTEAGQESRPCFVWTRKVMGTLVNGSGPVDAAPAVAPEEAARQSAAEKKKSAAIDAALSFSTKSKVAKDTPQETLGDIANVLRSKNAGPYEITLDVMFDTPAVYEAIKNSNLLGAALVSQLYNVDEKDVLYCGFFDQALAFKATIPRMQNGKRVACGTFMEADVHGSQHYLPLMNLKLPADLVSTVQAIRA